MRLAYLFSRYPIVSQTFCDTEMLALERRGFSFEVHSIYPPPTSFRHGHAERLKAEVFYAPPAGILKVGEARARKEGRWPAAFVSEQERKYGANYKPELRARNALYFADRFRARGIQHFHVHFANRAAHTALFIKAISGIPFSLSTHGQDFMVDLGNNELLREICREAEFVANETNYSRDLVASLCPDSAGKMARVYNGMDLGNFTRRDTTAPGDIPKIVAIGRLIEFKGFHHLVEACGELRNQNIPFCCEIIGEGPWRPHLEEMIQALNLKDSVILRGSLPQEEVFGTLQRADLFALPCIVDKNGASDVFPTVILEAMASGKAVVSTRLAGVPEEVIDGVTGALVTPGDVPELSRALGRLLASRELRETLGNAGRRRLEEEFTVERTVEPLAALFKKHAKESAPPTEESTRWAALMEEWPLRPDQLQELSRIDEDTAGGRLLVMRAGGESASEEGQKILPRCEFLPDGMVVEAEWRQEREIARRIETLRAELGQKVSSEFFLQCARYAVSLRRMLLTNPVRHLHAMGRRELLIGWILRGLGTMTLSASIENGAGLPNSIVARLGRDCVAVRFLQKNPELTALLEKAPGGPLVFPPGGKFGRSADREWRRLLLQWSAAPAN